MRAVQVSQYGGPDVLVPVELADPQAEAGEVIVRTAAIDTIYLETQIRGGWGEMFGVTLPYVPGGAAAGTVVSVGPDVEASWQGRRVLVGVGTQGAYAELVRAGIDQLVPVPDGLGLREAAALAHDGVTGMGILEAMAIKPSERVLILGAAGGMGTLLVQLAHGAGAHVIGAARGAEKLGLVDRLGADTVVDYSEDGWIERVRDALDGQDLDVLLDGVGGELGTAAFGLVGRGGRVSAHGAASGDFAELDETQVRDRGILVRGIEDVQFDPPEAARLAARALDEAAAGRMRPVIGREFALSDAAEAHRAIEARSIPGKALLIP
ncbi:zinc-binding dehydrogenase [Ruania halotolerans]|uniref:zinc-binding dehydrogenase n=1 Tax=Ruania halotolerans TaxID=2897773 RepID=UPI001E2B15AF|nr:zinc-binding dehydrogenase [Ruania halotolerans]UFU06578.1 zinc-binding dehydrogenase [Ruania halotolerans]